MNARRRMRRHHLGVTIVVTLGLAAGSVAVGITAADAGAPTMTLSPDSATIAPSGQVSLTATVTGTDETPNGVVDFTASDATTTFTLCTAVPVVAGSGFSSTAGCELTGSVLTDGVGLYTVTANYDGDVAPGDNTTATASSPVTVALSTPTVSLSGSESILPSGTTDFTATVSGSTGTPTGTVSFESGGAAISQCSGLTLSGGAAACDIAAADFGVGDFSITADYSGDANYAGGSSSPSSLSVSLASPIVALSPSETILLADSTAFVVTVSGGSGTGTGTVTFESGSSPIGGCTSLALSGGSASCALPGSDFGVGSYSITADYSGDGNYANATSSASSLTVDRDLPTVAAPDDETVSSGEVTLTASVFGSDPSGEPTGTVTFKSNGTAITGCAVTLDQDLAACTFEPQVLGKSGAFSVTASYGGDTNYSSVTSSVSTLTIEPYTPTVTIAAANVTGNETAPLNVSVQGTGGEPTGTVDVYVDNVVACTAVALSASGNAVCEYAVNVAPGPHTITASYSGGGIYAAASVSSVASAALTVDEYGSSTNLTPASESVPAQATNPTFTANVTVDQGGPAAGTVTFDSDGSPIIGCAGVALSGNSATCAFDAEVLGASGTYSITATYNGNATDGESTSSTSRLAVGTYPPSVALSPSTAEVSPSDTAAFNATVKGSGGTPTGTVTFESGSSAIRGCSSLALSGGSASCTVDASSLGTGSHSITAAYSGDGLYAAATSSGSTLTVASNAAPSPVVTTTPAPTNSPAPVVAVAAVGAVAKSTIPVSVSCFEATCTGTITATTRVTEVTAKHKKSDARVVTTRVETIGSTTYRISANTTAIEVVDLSPTALSALASAKSHHLSVSLTVSVAGGTTVSRLVSIAQPVRKKIVVSRAAVSRILLSAPSAVAGGAAATVTVRVRRPSGAPEAGALVRLTDGSGHAIAGKSGIEAKADPSGVATFKISDAVAERVRLTATVKKGKDFVRIGIVTLTFTSAIDAAHSGISAPASSIPADGRATARIVVSLRNGSDQPVANVLVQLSQTKGTSATVSPGQGTKTDATGDAVFEVTTKHAGTVAFSAKYSDGAAPVALSESVDVTFSSATKPPSSTTTTTTTTPPKKTKTPPKKTKHVSKPKSKAPAVDGTKSSVVAASSLTPSGVGTSITVTVRNTAGAPLAGQRVSLSPSVAAVISPSTGVTGSNGETTFKVSDPSAATTTSITYRGLDLSGNVAVGAPATVTYLPKSAPDASDSTITASLSGSSSATITVMVANFNGDPVRGVPVSLRSSARVHGDLNATTNASGLATFTVTDSATATVTFGAFTSGSASLDLGSVTVHFHG